MRVLVLGSGAREHALVARLAADRDVGEIVCRARKPGNRARSRAPSRSISPNLAALAELAERERDRLDRRRPGAAAEPRRRRSLRGGRTAALRSDRSRGAARIEQGVREGVHGAPRACRPRAFASCDSLDEALALVRVGRVRVSRRAEGRRPRRGKGRRDRGRSRGGRARPSSAAMTRAQVRRAPAIGSSSKSACSGPEVSFFVVCDGTRALPIGIGAGSQADLRRRSGAEHRRHGRVRAESAGRRRARSARDARDRRAGDRRDGGEGHPFRGFLYVGLMLTAGRPEGDRVQRAARRSRGAGRSCR